MDNYEADILKTITIQLLKSNLLNIIKNISDEEAYLPEIKRRLD